MGKILTVRERAALSVVMGVLAVGGLGGWYYRAQAAPPLVLKPTATATATARPSVVATPQATPTPAPVATELVVFVSGAVKKPGVYRFKSGQRLYQAVEKAGGFRNDANRDALNLADKLRDGDQVHVMPQQAPAAMATLPSKSATTTSGTRVLGRVAPTAPAAASTASKGESRGHGKFKVPGDGVVHLNSATLEELQQLPGIGPSMAERILEHRSQAGKFEQLADLQEVKGIGTKKFEKLQPFIAL